MPIFLSIRLSRATIDSKRILHTKCASQLLYCLLTCCGQWHTADGNGQKWMLQIDAPAVENFWLRHCNYTPTICLTTLECNNRSFLKHQSRQQTGRNNWFSTKNQTASLSQYWKALSKVHSSAIFLHCALTRFVNATFHSTNLSTTELCINVTECQGYVLHHFQNVIHCFLISISTFHETFRVTCIPSTNVRRNTRQRKHFSTKSGRNKIRIFR